MWYHSTNKEGRRSMDYPLAFTNGLLGVFRTNVNDSSPETTAYYKFLQISPNSTAGDSPKTTTVYFYETTNKRMSSIHILAIGY